MLLPAIVPTIITPHYVTGFMIDHSMVVLRIDGKQFTTISSSSSYPLNSLISSSWTPFSFFDVVYMLLIYNCRISIAVIKSRNKTTILILLFVLIIDKKRFSFSINNDNDIVFNLSIYVKLQIRIICCLIFS